MVEQGTAQMVLIFVNETDTYQHQALALAIMERLRRSGAAGATLLKGSAGFGVHGMLHTLTLVELATQLPEVIVWIDRADRIERILPQIQEMVSEGLIIVQPVEVRLACHRPLEHFPPNLSVEQIMTRSVVTARPADPISVVAQRLIVEDLRFVPVVIADNRLVGMVSEEDLLQRAQLALPSTIRQAISAEEALGALDPLALAAAREQPVASIMDQPVSVAPATSLAEAIEVMARHDRKRLPVIDASGRLIGLITRSAILRTVAALAPPLKAAIASSETAHTVEEIMLREVATVAPAAPLTAVLDALVQVDQRRVIVVDADRHVLGIITDGDLVRRATTEERPSLLQGLLGRWRGDALPHGLRLALEHRTAAEVMTVPAITIDRHATPIEAIRLLMRHHIQRLPVVDDTGALVGLVGRHGLLRALANSGAQDQADAG